MKHFKFENWRFGELENSIFDVTNRALAFTWKISGGSQFTVATGGTLATAEAITKHTFGGKHGADRENSWEGHQTWQLEACIVTKMGCRLTTYKSLHKVGFECF